MGGDCPFGRCMHGGTSALQNGLPGVAVSEERQPVTYSYVGGQVLQMGRAIIAEYVVWSNALKQD